MRQDIRLFPFWKPAKDLDQTGKFGVFSIEKRYRQPQHCRQTPRQGVIDLVNAEFVAVNAGTRDKGIQARLNAELLLRQPRLQASLLQSRSKNRRLRRRHSLVARDNETTNIVAKRPHRYYDYRSVE